MTQSILDTLLKSLDTDLWAFLPELILCGGIVLMLLLRVLRLLDRENMGWVALASTAGATVASGFQWYDFDSFIPASVNPTILQHSINLFGGMLIFDQFAVFVKILLCLFALLVIVLIRPTSRASCSAPPWA
jgi:NADH-quinone oxidoreductase subunit N